MFSHAYFQGAERFQKMVLHYLVCLVIVKFIWIINRFREFLVVISKIPGYLTLALLEFGNYG